MNSKPCVAATNICRLMERKALLSIQSPANKSFGFIFFSESSGDWQTFNTQSNFNEK